MKISVVSAMWQLSSLQLEEFIDFVFPSLCWSSHWSVCLVFDAEARVPSCRFLCPSFIWKRCNSHFQTPFHSSVCFNPAWDFGCCHPFNGCRCASFHVFHIPSSSSVSAVSISSPVSFLKETSLFCMWFETRTRRRHCLDRNLCLN